MVRMLLVCAALAALVAPLGGRASAAVSATITGAEAVNVRRGPGPDTAAIMALRRGATVQVEERVGQWALVVLENGERGYVNAAFIALAPGATLPVVDPTAAAAETPLPLETPEPTATGIAAAAPPAIDQELAALRQRLASLESTIEKSGAAAPPPADPEVPAEPPPPPVAMVEPPASLDVGPAMALAGVGLIVGFLFGTLYGQRQERNRRSRVRF